MKFPKEKVRIIQIVKSFWESGDYNSIFKLRDEIMMISKELTDSNVLDIVLASSFYLSRYDDTILLGEELLKNGYESLHSIYFVLLSCLGRLDIFHGVSIISRSKLLNSLEIKEYRNFDGANYSNILSITEKNEMLSLALIIVNFIEGLSRENMGEKEIDYEYVMLRSFEMIDTLYELGYSSNITNKLTENIKMIFFN